MSLSLLQRYRTKISGLNHLPQGPCLSVLSNMVLDLGTHTEAKLISHEHIERADCFSYFQRQWLPPEST